MSNSISGITAETLEQIKKQAEELKAFNNPNIYQIAAFQLKQQADYCELVLQQFEQDIKSARKNAAIGLLLLGTSLIFLFPQLLGIRMDEKFNSVFVNIGIVMVICGALVETSSFIMFYFSHSRKSKGLESLQEHLNISQRLLSANKICEDIRTGDSKKEAQIILIKSLLEFESGNKEQLKEVGNDDEKVMKNEITKSQK